MRRLITLIGLVALVGSAAACGPGGPATPELTNPREILNRTIQTTAGLRSMRVRIDLEMRQPNNPDPQGGFVEGAIDLGTGEMAFAGQNSDGGGAIAFILADGAAFTKDSSTGRWFKTQAPVGGLTSFFLMGGGGGPQPNIPAALAALADDPDVTVTLGGVEDCPAGRCYRTTVALQPAQVWELLVGLTGIDRAMGGAGGIDQPAGIPPMALEVYTDVATLRLVQLSASAAAADGNSLMIRFQIGAPNEAVTIEPPPPGLVDDRGIDFGIGGGGVAPEPAPVQPVPVETAVPATDGP